MLKELMAHFGEGDYKRELENAEKFEQPELIKQLELAQKAVQAGPGPAYVQGETCEATARRTFPGDLIAQLQERWCPICQELPGSAGQTELINGVKRTGDSVDLGCGGGHQCCAECLETWKKAPDYQGHTITKGCPECRGSLGNARLIKNQVLAFRWDGKTVAIPGQENAVSPVAAPAGAETRTSTAGAIFTRRTDLETPGGGEVWQIPSGRIWYDVAKKADGSIDKMNHERALVYCQSRGLTLPSRENFTELREQMGARPGSYQGYAAQILPNLDHWFWSSSVHPDSADVAFNFNSTSGKVDFYGRASHYLVRCER